MLPRNFYDGSETLVGVRVCYPAAMPQPVPKAILFDLDDTLAASFETPAPEMIERLIRVMARVPLSIITGRDFVHVEQGFLPRITPYARPEHLFVMAESSADSYEWDGSAWQSVYRVAFPPDENARIRAAIEEALRKTRVLEGQQIYGAQFVEKRGQFSFSMLGIEVPADMRYTWDPQHERRKALQRELATRMPEYDVFLGGATTIDVTQRGINKAAGVRWLATRLGIEAAQMLYVGDALYPGGNDAVILETGAQTRETSGPEETGRIIDELLAGYEATSDR